MGKRKAETFGDLHIPNNKSQKLSLSSRTTSHSEEKKTPIDFTKQVKSLVSGIYSKSKGHKSDLKGTESNNDNDDDDKAKAIESKDTNCSETLKVQNPVIDVNQPRLSDILLVEHAVKNLQSSIDSIIQSAPDEDGLLLMQKSVTDETNPQLTAALIRYKMKLAAKLKTMHNAKELEIFDQILNFEQLSDDFKAPKSMNFAPQFTPFPNSASSRPSSPSSDQKPTPKSSSSFGTHDESLPPLPEIRDPAIRARVFIHKSLIKDKLFLSKREQLHSHNERLEFLGDSVLNNMMTQIAYHRFPDASEGVLSVLRTKLISNATLMCWSSAYGLDKELKKNTPAETLNNGKMKLYADVFEAYIGGLMTENPNNYGVVYEWLKQLAEPILKTNEPKREERSEFRANAKMELYSLIGTASLGLHYDCTIRDNTSNPPEFTVEVRTRVGDLLGTGKGENIKVAGTRAAMQALDNKELIEKYSILRANTPREASKIAAHDTGKPTMKPGLPKHARESEQKEEEGEQTLDQKPEARPHTHENIPNPDSNGKGKYDGARKTTFRSNFESRSQNKQPAKLNRSEHKKDNFNKPSKGTKFEAGARKDYRGNTTRHSTGISDTYRPGSSNYSRSDNNGNNARDKNTDRF